MTFLFYQLVSEATQTQNPVNTTTFLAVCHLKKKKKEDLFTVLKNKNKNLNKILLLLFELLLHYKWKKKNLLVVTFQLFKNLVYHQLYTLGFSNSKRFIIQQSHIYN